jgi:hypothetical protein
MRQLYVAYMQGMKNMPQNTALYGEGGEIESLKNRMQLNYQSNRAAQQADYGGVLGQLQQKYSEDLALLEKRYLDQLMQL